MPRLRCALAPLVALWLSFQVGTVALVPLALEITATDSHAAECHCGHGARAMCPMHRHTPAASPNRHCSMQASNGTDSGVLTTIVGAAGMLPASTPTLAAPLSSFNAGPADVGVRDERPVPPDPPPPRA